MTRHQAVRSDEQIVGRIPPLAHDYRDELPPPRPSVERETPADFWRSFATFALLIAALYALALVGAAYVAGPMR